MGATFCNLYCRTEQADLLKTGISGDRLVESFNGWVMLLAEDRGPARLTRLVKKLPGDALIFSYFDDDFFELVSYRDGKKAASLGSGGDGSKLPLLAALLPDDPTALKKLKSIRDCASIEEKVSLLEETFGLPFYALYEQEKIPPAEKSDRVWKAVQARIKALRKRPNRFEIVPLPREKWPASSRRRMDLIDGLRDKIPSHRFIDLVMDLPWQTLDQPGRPGFLLVPMQLSRGDAGPSMGYNTLLAADTERRTVKAFSLPMPMSKPLMVNGQGQAVFVTVMGDRIVCLDQQGAEQWAFAPPLTRPQQLHPVRTDREELVICSCHGADSAQDSIWRISPEDGRVLSERVLPMGESAVGLRWLPDMELFSYYQIKRNSVILLNPDFSENRRYALGETSLRFDVGIYKGVYGYTNKLRRDGSWDLARLDLRTGEITVIHPEIPVFIHQVLSGGWMAGRTDEKSGTLNLLDQEGRVISRHPFHDTLLGLWEEDGQVYGAAIQPGRMPGLWGDSLLDTIRVFRLADSLKSSARPPV